MATPFIVNLNFENPLKFTSVSFEQAGVNVAIKAVGGTLSFGQAGGSQAIIPDGGGLAVEANVGGLDAFDVTLTQLNAAIPATVAYGYKNPTTGLTAYGAATTLPNHPSGDSFQYQFALKNLTSGALITGAAIDGVTYTERGT